MRCIDIEDWFRVVSAVVRDETLDDGSEIFQVG